MSDNSGPRAEAALSDAQRAMDNAVRTMFELAFRLEFLREAIERANTETCRQLWVYGWTSFPRLAEGMAEATYRSQFGQTIS